MRPIERNEILPIGEYETIRESFRSRIIAEKRHRRLAVGEHVTVVLENRDTALYQIQEMLRTERITSESGILHEIETYNELVPGANELSLTLFVEIPDRDLRDQMLVDLAGLEDRVSVEVNGERFQASGKRDGARNDRTTAVHYLKVHLTDSVVRDLRAAAAKTTVAVRIDHPRYTRSAELSPLSLRSIGQDFADTAVR